MHITHVMKKIDMPLVILRNKYAFQKVSRARKATIITPSHSDKVEKTVKVTDELHICTVPCIGLPLMREIRYTLRLMNLLRVLKSDIINLNSHLQISALPIIIAARRLKVPLVVTVHGVYSKTNIVTDTVQKLYLHTLCRLLWRTSRAVICLTAADAQEIVSYGCQKHKITVIPNWVNTELFRPRDKRNDSNIVWAGRFVSPKGLEYLVKAAKIVVNKYPNCKFILIGDGPLRSKIDNMVAGENLAEYFDFKGQISNDQVAEEMGNAAIFAFPSLKEGMPYAILEAASSGLAIVATDIPGIAAVLKDGHQALLVKPRDASSLADAIIMLLQDRSLMTKLQVEARKLVEEAYTVNIVVNKMLDLYEEILQKGESPFHA